MTFLELYSKLDERFPKSLSCEWDNDGIMCMPAPDRQVKKVLISLDITEDVVDFAIENRFDTIVSHHPLVFHSQKSLSVENYTQRKLIKLVKANINAMSFHTRLDAATDGVNDVLSNLVHLYNAEVDSIDPIGRVASIRESENDVTLPEFAKWVKLCLNSPCVFYSGNRVVKKVYICGGDGKDMIPAAIANGADTLLTGRASYNTMIDAKDMGLNIIEAGHYYTENPVCIALENYISSLDNSVKIEKIESNNIQIIK
ncbi:MAG: Nif3-like dinuclear metal center hexameric protein [Clostridia bacterium]|nr:Nif3-like dinuclear metal center hexameric protein [Clostridia bacterium]